VGSQAGSIDPGLQLVVCGRGTESRSASCFVGNQQNTKEFCHSFEQWLT